MALAPDAIHAAVLRHGGVVDGHEARQIPQQHHHEPSERLARAQLRHRHFDVVAAPAALDDPSRLGEANPDRGVALHHLGPELHRERLDAPGPHLLGDPLTERGEQALVDDAPLLPRGFAPPLVELHGLQRRPLAAHGDADARRLDDVVIDDEIQGEAVRGPRQAGEGEVLHPHAGMEKLRLVAGDEPGGVDMRLGPGPLQHLAPGLGADLLPRRAGEQLPRPPRQGGDLHQTRGLQQLAVALGGLEARHDPQPARPSGQHAARMPGGGPRRASSSASAFSITSR